MFQLGFMMRARDLGVGRHLKLQNDVREVIKKESPLQHPAGSDLCV